MKQSLQLKLGQYLTMTPQLQQAIRLLQLSTLELQMEIQQALETNPMLELTEEEDEEREVDDPRLDQLSAADEDRRDGAGDDGGGPDDIEVFAAEDRERDLDAADSGIPDELPVDSVWEDVYDGTTSYSRGDDEERGYELREQGGDTLQEHLVWQMEMGRFSASDREIALAIIDSVNEDGYLSMPLEEIHEGLVSNGLDVELDEVEAVLHRVQHFDPVGVAARDLQDCLLLQLQALPADTPWRSEALLLVREHLELAANRDFKTLVRRLRLEEAELAEVLDLVRSLNPRPGTAVASAPAEYIIPDVFVRKVKGVWRVELNPEVAPKLRVNTLYANMLNRSGDGRDASALKGQLQEARWLIKSLQSRAETLLKVATCIVEHQREFLEQGEEAMKPLVLRDIAEAVSMHESTVSRITTQKYMHTPRGIFELKYFFSSHVGTADGGECSSTAIRARIKKLVAAEEPRKPLSDSKIAEILGSEGINVARRTVAKYREAMNIPASNERRRLT